MALVNGIWWPYWCIAFLARDSLTCINRGLSLLTYKKNFRAVLWWKMRWCFKIKSLRWFFTPQKIFPIFFCLPFLWFLLERVQPLSSLPKLFIRCFCISWFQPLYLGRQTPAYLPHPSRGNEYDLRKLWYYTGFGLLLFLLFVF